MFLVKTFSLLTYFLLVFFVAHVVEFYLNSLAGTFNIFALFERYIGNISSIFPQAYSTKSNFQSTNFHHKEEAQTFNHHDQNEDNTPDATQFSTYGEFIENVEDTTATIWVVNINSISSTKNPVTRAHWKWLSKKLSVYGIKTANYDCRKDPRLCIRLSIYTPSILLSIPKGSSKAKGNNAYHIYDHTEQRYSLAADEDIFQWIKSRLYPRVKTVHSFNELSEVPVARRKRNPQTDTPSLSFIYQSNRHSPPPLFLTALSVRFTGRIKFYILKTDKKVTDGDAFAMNEYSKYTYGVHKGEQFNYPCMELFFRTLHPELNDLFIVSAILLNMACWLELFLQKGGPLRRILFYLWGLAMANLLLVSIWLPLIQLLYVPQIQPFLNLLIKKFQQVMLSNFAAIIRQDFLQVSQHMHIVFIGFVCYGALLGYLHYKLRHRNQQNRSNSMSEIFDSDIQELSDIFRSILFYITPTLRVYRFEQRIERILNRLATPDLWLHSFNSNEFMNNLPVWTHCNKCTENYGYSSGSCLSSESEMYFSDIDDIAVESSRCLRCYKKFAIADSDKPSHVKISSECVVCLENYKCRELLLALPCGHVFHKCCIDDWLLSGNGCNKKRCPICRWPADVSKGKYEVIDAEE